jgi:hypothetical protein
LSDWHFGDGVPLTGIAVDKNVYKQALCEKASDIAAVIFAYAAPNDNSSPPLNRSHRFNRRIPHQTAPARHLHRDIFSNRLRKL